MNIIFKEFRTYLCFFGKTTERQRLTRRCYCFDAGSETMEIYHIMGLAFQLSAQQQQQKASVSFSWLSVLLVGLCFRMVTSEPYTAVGT